MSTLRDFINSSDIICLQETNLSATERLALSSLPNCTVSFNSLSMSTAGTLVIDTPSISQFYWGSDVPLPPCCKGYVQLRRYLPKNPLYKPFQLFNIYLPTCSNKTFLQTQILHALLSVSSSLPSFFAGDFNFITSPEDSSNPSPSLPPAAFLSLFNSLKEYFAVSEVPHNEHTYFHITKDPTSPYSYSTRLDRFYIPSSLFHSLLSSPSASVFCHPSNFRPSRQGARSHFSDHLPISLNFVSDSPRVDKKPLIPLWLASSPEFATNLRASWRAPTSYNNPFKLLSQYKKALFRAAAATRKSRLLSSSFSLRFSQHLSLLRAISTPSQDPSAIERLFSYDPSLQSLVTLRLGVWHDNGLEQATREFLFQASSPPSPKAHPISSIKDKLPSTRTRISSLRSDPSDPPISDDRGKAEIASSFWSEVWAPRSTAPSNLEREAFLDSYTKKVDTTLLSPPLLDDVIFSITHSNNSAPGPDGVPYAAWRAAPELAGPILFAVLEAICKGQAPPSGYNYGLLFLIPKKHTGLISDTRPISVTNTDNRILASTIAHSIMPAVSSMVHPSQKGFLWGKNGIDHTCDINQFFFEGVVKKHQRLLFFLDTAKAFDSIDHSWAIKVLSKADFPPWVIRFIQSSLRDVKVAPCFGNDFSLWIDILRGVKQGCPLSPLIFILAYDPLLTALSTLPNIKAYAFADDIALSALTISDISPALSLFSLFSFLSGLGINKVKSCVISSGLNRSHKKLTREISNCPWPDLPLRPSATHLGIPIGRDITLAEIFEAPYNKAVSRLASSQSVVSSFSVSSRILFVNTFIISLFSYHFLFFILPKEFYATLKELIRKLVTPFNGGAYSYDSLVSLQLLFSIRPPLKDLWAFNVALLASRSPLISTSTNYNLLPAISLRTSKFIQDHRNASAVDFWRDRHLEDGTLLPLPNSSSTTIYQALIIDIFLPLATLHSDKKISSFISINQPLSTLPPSCIDPLSSALASASYSLPSSFLFHHFSLVNNALATSRRMRHQNNLPISKVLTCSFCFSAQDSLLHIYSACPTVHSARSAFFSSLDLLSSFSLIFPSFTTPSFSLPLSFTFLISVPTTLIIPTIVFNLAVWRFRNPSLGSRDERDDAWRAARITELASSLFLRVKKRPPPSSKDDVSIFSHDDLLASSDRLSIVCYTDGSASPNPGPAGSGASIFLPMSNTVVDLGASLGHNSNNFAELYAIGTCLSTLVNTFDLLPSRPSRVLLFTDSLYASRAVTSTKPPASHKDTIVALRRLLAKALALIPVSLVWVRGHCGAGGNERVDRIAKRFAKCSINPPFLRPTSFPSVSTTSHWPFPLAVHSSTPLHVFLSNLPSPPATPVGSVDPFLGPPLTVQLSDDSGLDFKHSD